MKIKDMIEEMYENENLNAFIQAETKAVNIALPVGTYALLRVIAKRFDKSLSSLGSEILSDATKEMWFYLSENDKKTLSEEADALAQETLVSQGVSLTPDYDYWTDQFKTFVSVTKENKGAESK